MTTLASAHRVRVRVFVDYWNFQISLNQSLKRGFRADWERLGQILAQAALRVVDSTAQTEYQGMDVYGSYAEDSESDQKHRRWAEYTLAGFPGVQVVMLPRRRRLSGPTCPKCHKVMSTCPHCRADMRGTEEKGLDTRIATAMISLAWDQNYDLAVLVSSDHDFVPVVEFLRTRGIKVVHGAFPPTARELTAKCWGHIDICELAPQFDRLGTAPHAPHR